MNNTFTGQGDPENLNDPMNWEYSKPPASGDSVYRYPQQDDFKWPADPAELPAFIAAQWEKLLRSDSLTAYCMAKFLGDGLTEEQCVKIVAIAQARTILHLTRKLMLAEMMNGKY